MMLIAAVQLRDHTGMDMKVYTVQKVQGVQWWKGS